MRVRRAVEADLPDIVRLLADDFLGALREQLGPPLPEGYRAAFREITASPDAALFVAEDGAEIVGTFQVDFLHRLSRAGRLVAEIESVHVAHDRRSRGIGAQMMAVAIEEVRARGCHRIQLTSNKQRSDAHRFYERLGFQRSHEGFKLFL